ncbi:transcription-repair coupling factor [Sporolactobacillus sp. STSJ-5]|uniref:transcription-repair coupling factor n=1 Tax=Sporolactobacillus sp. STSJ-5 TaxID=2965076 RepID=UPI002103ED34|nr:transcription-repair coupling factor [Sporolactobacillus sp. STSJ-5]MCQ2011237.1 transcription-repair coupling factor [Sporolactobacillus sp. STSJ-5]
MLGLSHYYQQNIDEIQTVLEGYEQGMKQQLVSGLSGGAKALWIAAVYQKRHQTSVVVTHNLYQGQKLYNDLEGLIDSEELFLYPANDLIASELAVASPELLAQRIDVLNRLAQNRKALIIIPVAGLKKLLAPLYLWKASLLQFEVGKTVDLDALPRKLTAMGYERESMVAGPGQFSIRGGIIDLFPLTEAHPIRIELFDDEIDSVRYFDSDSQRSLEMIQNSVLIGPARELLLYEENYAAAAQGLEHELAVSLAKMKDQKAQELLSEHSSADIESLKQGVPFNGMIKYASLYYNKLTTIDDYLPEDALIIFDEISRIQEMSEQLDREEAEWRVDMLQRGDMVSELPLTMSWPQLTERLSHPLLLLSLFLRYHGQFQPQNVVSITCRAMQNFHGQIQLLKTEVERWKKGDFSVTFLASDKERAKRLDQVLSDYGIQAEFVAPETPPVHGVNQITIGQFEIGFELPLKKIAVITEQEVFTKKTAKANHHGKKLSNAERLKNYSELKVGDYVVHVDHGIGRYAGIETLEVNGTHKDYLQIIYKGNDKLYVPVEHIDQVQKYVSSEGKEPKIYALGGGEWKKVKSKARSSIQDIADDLIKLYAKREASKGYAFAKDSDAQQEFEAAFPYEETTDQLQAIEEIKKDMENEKPMDRLLCGDVGYGKTEVALRAAFKAIADGKQVALLVPTTILAQQHFETASERFEDFPVTIGLLSRFRSRKEQMETLKGLKAGTVDLVIGTHRLLSKDVQYKDLGLLIVDEEQRFGVTHKEKIKRLKANVDVLTLTATPIPRTLHMSMLGVRDLSIIETPPENRFPVQTFVMEYNASLIREAIEREMARGGQVYFLYNRVETIQRMAEMISGLVPDAAVTFAHGQMKESELESAMIDFLDGNADVLVSTTIIETGVDIPNVNTLIVYDADRMGLAQLYQLRGRVGRSSRVAYAYFTYQRDKVMNEVAEKRLQAIKEFTELGSGFKIAMRDLSIRGAGNLLGAQQHGFIDSVGFDLYSQMLQDAIAERSKKSSTDMAPKPPKVTIEMETDAYIPDLYIEDSLQKIDMYKRFKAAASVQDVEELKDEMIDRFGDYPREVADLFKVAEIRVTANQLMIEEIKQQSSEVRIIFSEMGWKSLDRESLFKAISKMGSGVGLGAEGSKMKITIKQNRRNADSKLLEEVAKLLGGIEQLQKPSEKVG